MNVRLSKDQIEFVMAALEAKGDAAMCAERFHEAHESYNLMARFASRLAEGLRADDPQMDLEDWVPVHDM